METSWGGLQVIVIGNYSPSNHEASRILNPIGIAPTIKENHGTVNGVMEIKDNYYLSEKMKAYINSFDDSYEGMTRADSSDYIRREMKEETNINNMDVKNYRIRKLTPKECYRLMGFCKRQSDGTFDDTDYERASSVNSSSQLYKQAGNSIVVDVLEAIFKEML